MTLRRERTRERILDGAAAAFARSGYTATSMDEVASTAGVSRLLLYRDFDGKQELYRAVLHRATERIGDDVLAAATGGAAFRRLFAVARSDPHGFLLLFWHAPREPLFAEAAEAFLARAEDVAEQLLTHVEPDPLLRRWAARVSVRHVIDAVVLWLRLGDPDRDEEAIARILGATRATSGSTVGPLRRAEPGTTGADT